jgi:hypothetical protein
MKKLRDLAESKAVPSPASSSSVELGPVHALPLLDANVRPNHREQIALRAVTLKQAQWNEFCSWCGDQPAWTPCGAWIALGDTLVLGVPVYTADTFYHAFAYNVAVNPVARPEVIQAAVDLARQLLAQWARVAGKSLVFADPALPTDVYPLGGERMPPES